MTNAQSPVLTKTLGEDSLAKESQTGFFARFRNRVARPANAQQRDTSSAKLAALLNFLRTGDGTGKMVNGYTQNITVFRCVNQIATTLARVPLLVYRGEHVVREGAVYDLINRPNRLMGHTKFIHTIVAQELLHGASYVYLDAPDSRGVPRSLLPLTPEQIAPVRPRDNLYDLQGWQIGVGGSKALQVPPSRVARFEYAISEVDPLLPVSPLEVANLAVKTDYLSALWNKQVIENSGTPAGILKWQGDGRLDEKDAGLIRDQWMESYGGAQNAESIAILGANFDFQQIGHGAKDLQYAEGRRWNLAEIARAFNVPTLYLNEYSATGLSDAGLKVQEKLFYHNTIQPIAAVIADVLNRVLVQPIDSGLRLAWEWSEVDALRDDYTEKLKHADQLWRLGYPINKINKKLNLGMDDVPWGDDAFVQAQMITADAALSQSEMFGANDPMEPVKPVEIEQTTETVETTEADPAAVKNAFSHRAAIEWKAKTSPSTRNLPKGYVVQSLILSKQRFSTVESAVAWVEDNGFRVRKIDETEKTYRFRQREPNDFQDGSFRTIELDEGVLATVGVEADPEERIEGEVEGKQERRVSVPSFISENAKRGIKYHEEGKSGDGIRPHTIREANDMVSGSITEDKLVRMAAWFKRHESDLDAPKNSDPDHEDYPGAGAVAWLLWGGNPTSDPMRASEWADRKIAQIEDDNARYTDEEKAQRRAWWQRQQREVMTLERKMIGKIRRDLLSQRAVVLNEFGELTEDSDGFEIAEAVERAANVFDVDQFVNAISPTVDEAADLGGKRADAELKDLSLPPSGGAIDALAALYVARRGVMLTGVGERMRDKVARAVVSSYAEGKSVSDITNSVRDSFNGIMSTGKARTIARTEVNTAVNTVRYTALTNAGVSMHEWISENDDLVRSPDNGSEFDHNISGARVVMGQPFPTGSGACSYPGDPSAPAGDTINCRCTTVPVVDGRARMLDFPDMLKREIAEDE